MNEKASMTHNMETNIDNSGKTELCPTDREERFSGRVPRDP